jgi:Tc toxin complex TcA C-terminal TcB-binding domain
MPFYQLSQLAATAESFQTTAPVFNTGAVVVSGAGATAGTPSSVNTRPSTALATGEAANNASTPSVDEFLRVEQYKYYCSRAYMPGTLVKFDNHYHPWVDQFIVTLNWIGVPQLLDITTQELGRKKLDLVPGDIFDFYGTYGPTNNVAKPYPKEVVELSLSGAYSIYNWELFFHIPFLIATQLSQNQQFEDANTWFEYIFNPTIDSDEPVPNRYWNFLYFNQHTLDGQIGDLLTTLMQPGSTGYQEAYNQVQQWWNSPLDPDVTARLRPVAYEKAVVMAYIDNLIAWGDNLFSQNTRESINEATQIYVLADKILGPKPVMVPPQGTVLPVAYKDLQWDGLDNALVTLENAFPFTISSNPSSGNDTGSSLVTSQGGPSTGKVPYFCTPVNSQLLAYWDTVANRLYKIRHCMNIQGQVQQLPLFSPPINPALLVQAAAAGVDLSSVLSDINAAVPYYRFTFMLSKAVELCAEVRSLGAALLSALEKKDAEALSLLRASQEVAVLQAVLLVKRSQISEAQANVQALNDSLAVAQAKQNYYQTLVAGGLSALETAQANNLTQSQTFKQYSQIAGLVGSDLSLILQFELGVSGFGGTPSVNTSFGGQQLATMASMVAQAFSFQAEYYSFAATMSGLMGGWARRAAEWGFQLQTAGLELTQINDQINAANFRATIAQEDLDNQNLQISNAQAVQGFLTNKFTNEDLYSWMIDQVSGVYFQCYQMAYDLAKRAEASFRLELGLSDSNFIQFGYWDSLKLGLQSGEKLYLDLKRLETAYMDQNKREYEITRNISLVLLDPIALITLKETGAVHRILARGLIRYGLPRPLHAPHQEPQPDDTLRHRALHQRQLHLDAAPKQNPFEHPIVVPRRPLFGIPCRLGPALLLQLCRDPVHRHQNRPE